MSPSPVSPLRSAVLLLLVLAGCASQQPHVTAASGAPANPGELPPCVGATASLERPADFPAGFPLPPGTVLASQERRSGGRLILHAFTPWDTQSVARFFAGELPRTGYRITDDESETGEAEARFESPRVLGRYVARDVGGCPGAVSLDLLVGPRGH